jgi:hypothetical protein
MSKFQEQNRGACQTCGNVAHHMPRYCTHETESKQDERRRKNTLENSL